MPKKKKIIVGIAFNTKKLTNYKKSLTSVWIHKRIKIFQNFTRKSLQKQSNQDFITLIEYEDKTEKAVKKALHNYKKLPENIIFIPKSRFEQKMKELITGYKHLYLVRLDSDDLYKKSYIKKLHRHHLKKKVRAIINQKGYMYDVGNNRMAPMNAASPAFYTLIYKVKDYLKGKRYRLKNGHPAVIRLRHDKMHGRNYIHIIHSGNTTSRFRSKTRKRIDKKRMIKGWFKVKRVLRRYM